MAKYGQKGHLWPHIWQISQVRYPWNHRKCALCISVHHRNVEIHLGKYVYFTAHSVPTVELIMNRHGQVRSLCHPCRKDERSSKRSVKRLFEKILIGDTVTWWNCNPRLLPVFLLHHTKLLHPECTPSLRAYSVHSQSTLSALSDQENTRIGQMAINSQIWSKWTFFAVSGQVQQIGGTDPVQRAEAWVDPR